MTVSRDRRRITTTRAVVASIVGLAIAVGLGAAGYVAIANTTDGQVVGGGPPEVTFPVTPTAALAVVDGNGNLASVAVLAVRPSDDGDDEGRGGSVVPVPISADSTGGFGTERTPLNETVALFGPESLADELPVLLGVGIDELTVVDEAELAELLAPLGPVEVQLPAPVLDARRQVAGADPQTMTPRRLAEVLAAIDPTSSGADRYPTDVAVWEAIADAVGDGSEPATGDQSASSAPNAVSAGSDVFTQLISGSISVQPLRSSPIVSLDRNPRGVDAVALDYPEMLVIFGHIAPGKVDAPNAGYNFRIVSPYSTEQLDDGASRLDVAYTATAALLAVDANVVSVETSSGEAGTATVIEVSAESLLAAASRLGEMFGEVDVRIADPRIAGVDVTVTLGTDYLSRLDAAAATDSTTVPGTGGPPSTPTDTSAGGGE